MQLRDSSLTAPDFEHLPRTPLPHAPLGLTVAPTLLAIADEVIE
jgi:hypothetical protein